MMSSECCAAVVTIVLVECDTRFRASLVLNNKILRTGGVRPMVRIVPFHVLNTLEYVEEDEKTYVGLSFNTCVYSELGVLSHVEYVVC